MQKGHWRVDGFGSRMVEAREKGCTFTFFVLVSASGCKKVRNSLFSMTYIFVADAHRDDGKRFVVRADEKLTAFLELGSAIRAVTS